MSTVILKSEHAYKANQKNNLPYLGDVTFNENAEIEVSVPDAEKLMAIMSEFSIVGGSDKKEEGEDLKKKSEDSEELGKSQESDIEPQVDKGVQLHTITQEDLYFNGDLVGEVVVGDKVDTSEQKEPSKDEIVAALNLKSATELKEILSQYPKDLTKGLKNKTQYVEFLTKQLSA